MANIVVTTVALSRSMALVQTLKGLGHPKMESTGSGTRACYEQLSRTRVSCSSPMNLTGLVLKVSSKDAPLSRISFCIACQLRERYVDPMHPPRLNPDLLTVALLSSTSGLHRTLLWWHCRSKGLSQLLLVEISSSRTSSYLNFTTSTQLIASIKNLHILVLITDRLS